MNLNKAKLDIETFTSYTEKIDKLPLNLEKLEAELEAKKLELDALMKKAEDMIENLKKSPVETDEFNKVKVNGEENTLRLDLIQKR